MNQKTTELSAYLKPSTNLDAGLTEFQLPACIESPTPSTGGKIFYAEFIKTSDVPLPDGYNEIEDLVSQYEADPARAAALKAARITLASRHFAGKSLSISSLRLGMGMSQRQLAEIMGTSQSHVARIEAGREDLRLSTIKKLARAFDKSTSEIISFIDAES